MSPSPKSNHYQYVYGKLSETVHRLAVGEGDVRCRLKWACEVYNSVNKSLLPKELYEKWDWINSELNKFPSNYGKTSQEITLTKIRNSTGSKIAKAIVSLKSELEQHL